jgi:hypothetical protein
MAEDLAALKNEKAGRGVADPTPRLREGRTLWVVDRDLALA